MTCMLCYFFKIAVKHTLKIKDVQIIYIFIIVRILFSEFTFVAHSSANIKQSFSVAWIDWVDETAVARTALNTGYNP